MIQRGIIVGRSEGSRDVWPIEVLDGANFIILICEDLSCFTARLLSSAETMSVRIGALGYGRNN